MDLDRALSGKRADTGRPEVMPLGSVAVSARRLRKPHLIHHSIAISYGAMLTTFPCASWTVARRPLKLSRAVLPFSRMLQ